MYYVVAFPELTDTDAAWIDGIRARHDAAKRACVGPHFTFVFAVPEAVALSAQTRAHLIQIANATPPIDFTCSRTVPFADHAGPEGYVFLHPNGGNEAMEALRARLHTGHLAPFLSENIDWIAHITIAKMSDIAEANRLSAEINHGAFAINGRLASLSLVRFDGAIVDTIQEFTLTS